MKSRELLGRGQEIAELRRIIAEEGDAGSVLLTTGEPGIGNSALLAEARARAARAAYRVLAYTGAETETHLPFGGLQQIMAPLMSGVDCIPRIQGEALSTALGFFDGPRPDLFLIAEAALLLLVEERRKSRLLVTVDDLQWLDSQTHQIVTFLAHRSIGTGLTLIAAARPGHDGPFVNASFPTLEVVGVNDSSADRILRSHVRGLTPADRTRVRREARGNPLALLELPTGLFPKLGIRTRAQLGARLHTD